MSSPGALILHPSLHPWHINARDARSTRAFHPEGVAPIPQKMIIFRPTFKLQVILMNRILLATVLTFITAMPSFAAELCAGNALVAVRSAPAGSQKAQIFPGGCVKPLGENREGWVKVSFEGWVDSKDLSAKQVGGTGVVGAGAGVVGVAAENPLELLSYEITEAGRDLQGVPSKVILKMKIRNKSQRFIQSWSGLIAAQNRSGEYLFRYRVSDDKAMNPGGEVEVGYYWDNTEEPYEVLTKNKKDDLKIVLVKIDAR